MSGLLFVGMVIAVLWLCSRLTETRYQLGQSNIDRDNARFERDQALHELQVFERIYNDACEDLLLSTTPRRKVEQ